MNDARVLDVSELPTYQFGHKALIWWGATGFMVIEGSMFLMVALTYFYLRLRVPEWPPGLPNPDLLFGTINTAILLVSCLPNQLTKSAAQALDLRRTRLWLIVSLAFGVAFLVVRWFEFGTLNCRWDSNAYGSVVWVLMALHTTHLLTEVIETAVLTALAFRKDEISGSRFVDISESAEYWYFVVAAWLPIYLTIYFAPRWL